MMIRPAVAADSLAIAALERAAYHQDAYPTAFFAQAILQWPQLCFVALIEQEIQGYALYAPDQADDTCWLMSLLIAPICRGQGVGQALCRYAQPILKQQGFRQCLLTVAPTNTAALHLYEGLEFSRSDYLEHALGPNEHRYLMRQTL